LKKVAQKLFPKNNFAVVFEKKLKKYMSIILYAVFVTAYFLRVASATGVNREQLVLGVLSLKKACPNQFE